MPIVISDAVGGEEGLVLAEPLDEREDIVPAAAVEADDMVAQLVEDLVHLERRRQRLDQHRRLERPMRDAEFVLRVGEHLVP